MCGIAGLSQADPFALDPTALLRLLIAGLAERGQDASGYAYHGPDGRVEVVKDSLRLAAFMGRIAVPDGAAGAIAHVRDFTKGRPGLNDNNHPIRYGRTVGVHNGHIDNDDELFAAWGKERSTPLITVDSEAIVMLVDTLGDADHALEQVRGSAAIAVLRDGEPQRLTLAKRASRTLWLGEARGLVLFASTREPLELARRATGRRLHIEEVQDGTLIEVERGEVVARSRFAVDRRYVGRPVIPYPVLPEKPELVRRALDEFAA
jgi:glucosamine 6-phosphate synthetase-like amidotransferase/phosphosugar isomerase protein